MTNRPSEWWEYPFVPNISTNVTTPTARSINQPWQDCFSGCPWLWSHNRIGDGALTARSRAEVARITRRLGGKL